MLVKATALCLAFYSAQFDTKNISSKYDWQSKVMTLAQFKKEPVIADDLLKDDKVVIDSKTMKQLLEKPLEEGVYRVVGYGDLPQIEISRLKKNYGISARKVLTPEYFDNWTYTIGFGDIEFTGLNLNIQKFLAYQGRHPSHLRVISLDRAEPNAFIEIMTELFFNAPQDPWSRNEGWE